MCLLVNTLVYWTFFTIFTFLTIRSCCDSKTDAELKAEIDNEEKLRKKEEANKMI